MERPRHPVSASRPISTSQRSMRPPSTRLQIHPSESWGSFARTDDRAGLEVLARIEEALRPAIEEDIEVLGSLLDELRQERMHLEEDRKTWVSQERERLQEVRSEYERTADRLIEASRHLKESTRDLDQTREQLCEEVLRLRSRPVVSVAAPVQTSDDALTDRESYAGQSGPPSDQSAENATELLERLRRGIEEVEGIDEPGGHRAPDEESPRDSVQDTTGFGPDAAVAESGEHGAVDQEETIASSPENLDQTPSDEGVHPTSPFQELDHDDDFSLEEYLAQFTKRFGIADRGSPHTEGVIAETSEQTGAEQEPRSLRTEGESPSDLSNGPMQDPGSQARSGSFPKVKKDKKGRLEKKAVALNRMRDLANLSSEEVLMIHELRSLKNQAKNQLAFAAVAFLFGITLMAARWLLSGSDTLVWIASGFFVGASVFLLLHLWTTKSLADKRKHISALIDADLEEASEAESPQNAVLREVVGGHEELGKPK